jgi:hypothetical protein
LALLALVYVARRGIFATWNEFQRACWQSLFIVNAMALIRNAFPRSFWTMHDGKISNDGKRLLRLFQSKSDIKNRVASGYLWEIEACLETGRVNEARRWLTEAQRVGYKSVNFRYTELLILGLERNWKQVCANAKDWMSTTHQPLEREGWAAWAAISTIYTGGDLAEAEAFCKVAMSLTPWDPAAQCVRALVSLVQGNLTEAEHFLTRARTSRSEWTAQAAGAHIWAVLYRCKGDIAKQRKWEARARVLDPLGAFALIRSGGTNPINN